MASLLPTEKLELFDFQNSLQNIDSNYFDYKNSFINSETNFYIDSIKTSTGLNRELTSFVLDYLEFEWKKECVFRSLETHCFCQLTDNGIAFGKEDGIQVVDVRNEQIVPRTKLEILKGHCVYSLHALSDNKVFALTKKKKEFFIYIWDVFFNQLINFRKICSDKDSVKFLTSKLPEDKVFILKYNNKGEVELIIKQPYNLNLERIGLFNKINSIVQMRVFAGNIFISTESKIYKINLDILASVPALMLEDPIFMSTEQINDFCLIDNEQLVFFRKNCLSLFDLQSRTIKHSKVLNVNSRTKIQSGNTSTKNITFSLIPFGNRTFGIKTDVNLKEVDVGPNMADGPGQLPTLVSYYYHYETYINIYNSILEDLLITKNDKKEKSFKATLTYDLKTFTNATVLQNTKIIGYDLESQKIAIFSSHPI